MFLMNRDGFSLLAMGLTGAKAMQFKVAFIEQFNAMERVAKAVQSPTPAIPQTFAEALRLAAALREDVMMDLGLVRSYVEDLAVDIQSLRRIMDYLISVTEESNDYRLLAVSALAVLIDRDLAMMDDRRDEIERLLLRQCV